MLILFHLHINDSLSFTNFGFLCSIFFFPFYLLLFHNSPNDLSSLGRGRIRAITWSMHGSYEAKHWRLRNATN